MQYSDIFGSVRSDFLLIACLVTIALLARTWWRRRSKFPPGPFSLPIIGYVPILFSSLRQIKLMQLGHKYGGVFSVGFGTMNCVVISSGEAAREILVKPELVDRPDQEVYLLVSIKEPFFGNGPPFFEHKKFALRVFRNLNTGKAMERHITSNVKKLMEVLRDQRGKPYDSRELLFATAVDVILQVIFGEHFQVKEHERVMVHKFVAAAMKMIERSTILFLYPWLKHFSIVRKILRLDEFQAIADEADNFLKVKVKEAKAYHDGTADDCLAGYYYKELISIRETGQISTFSEQQLIDGAKVLFAAASETIRDSLTWALYTMAVYDDTQRKVQKEIDEVIGCENTPTFSDQKNMRYTQAVLMELQRWKTIAPLGIRFVTADTNFGPYRVPKGTPVLVNHCAIHSDPRYWRNPDDFVPERFLTAGGKHILKHENYMPFSYGKRSCIGEGIAVMELFLFFTCILQKFTVKLPEGEKPNFDGLLSLSYQLKRSKLRYIPRNN